MKLHDKYQTALEAHGWQVDLKARSTKYTVMHKDSDPQKIYLGRSGSVRRGSNLSDSFPVSDAYKKRLLESKV